MLFYYKELLEKGFNRYQINKKIKNREIFKVSRDIYSDEEYPSDLSIIMKKYPRSILTLNSAFFYYDLTDKIPEYYYLATEKKSHAINEDTVKQIFTTKKFLYIGLTQMKIEDTEVNIYDKERMLIELIRYKTKLPYELYKEVINSYRKMKEQIDFIKVYKYAKSFNNSYIIRTIETEVI